MHKAHPECLKPTVSPPPPPPPPPLIPHGKKYIVKLPFRQVGERLQGSNAHTHTVQVAHIAAADGSSRSCTWRITNTPTALFKKTSMGTPHTSKAPNVQPYMSI